MIDEEFQGWRITISDDGQIIGFSNRPLVLESIRNEEIPLEPKDLTIPADVISHAHKLAAD